jgi:two-component sensor histidine kinase
LGVGEAAATNLALVVHELATNSVKYGALSAKTGTLESYAGKWVMTA